MFVKFEHVKISGISVVEPEKEINIYDEAEYYDNNIKKIDRMRKWWDFGSAELRIKRPRRQI